MKILGKILTLLEIQFLMKKIALSITVALMLISCGSSRNVTSRSHSRNVTNSKNTKTSSIIKTALSYEGTRYKYGGTTKKGMDCSGLVYTSFKKEEVDLPRSSREMSKKGKSIPLKKAMVGDLLFFKTNKNKNVVNHVGLVVEVKNQIQFIHASVSRGVIVSSLDEQYWRRCHVGTRRIVSN